MQNMTVNSTFGVGSIATTDRQSAAQQLAEQYPIVKRRKQKSPQRKRA